MALWRVLFALNDGQLTGYSAGDVIEVVPASLEPGSAVLENDPVRFGFFFFEHPNAANLNMTDNLFSGDVYQAKRAKRLNIASLPANDYTSYESAPVLTVGQVNAALENK